MQIKRDIFTVCNYELEEIQTLCKQHSVTVNDYLIAKMMLEENTIRWLLQPIFVIRQNVADKGQWEIILLLLAFL